MDLQILVTAIAVGTVPSVLASAQPHRFLFRNLQLLGRKPGSFVGTITERLGLRSPAGAPPISARFQIHGEGCLLCNGWICHDSAPLDVNGSIDTAESLAIEPHEFPHSGSP